jgi:hypothetical protein
MTNSVIRTVSNMEKETYIYNLARQYTRQSKQIYNWLGETMPPDCPDFWAV